MLTLLICGLLVASDGAGNKPTAAQTAQAYQLLNGEWQIVSYTDDGEILGPGLIRAKLAKDGRVKVVSQAFTVVNPETNEARVTPFRVNPLKVPKQIEITTRDDRVVGGIFKFDGDDLVVCLESFPDSGFPSGFDASAGSNRTLIKLRIVIPESTTETQTEAESDVAKPTTASASASLVLPAEPAALATIATARKPTDSELARVRELFAGNWDITSIVDDGEKLGSELIRRRFAENGRVRFGTRSFSFVNPRTEERKINAYRLDPTKSPSEIDVTTQFDSVLKGIYAFDGDKLTVCLAKNEDGPRPDRLDAPGGSDRLLVRMQLARDDSALSAARAESRQQPQPRPKPSAEADAAKFDANVRRLITGAWELTDTKGTLTTVFQPDGAFLATRSWARGAKRLFGPPSDNSNGSWTYRTGLLSAWVTTTTDPRVAGHRFSARVQTIGEDTMVVTDAYGSVKTVRRLR